MDSLERPLKVGNILKPAKIGLIVLLVAAVTILHYSTIHGKLGLHIPHRELYFIPIFACQLLVRSKYWACDIAYSQPSLCTACIYSRCT